MKDNKLKWYIADREYINYLRKYDNKVENIDYDTKLKPYIGILITINDFNYYVPISSAKEKHYKIKEGIDFVKIMQDNKIIGVLNLNNMIPISDDNVKALKYKDIEKYRDFTSDKEKKLYISFLSFELDLINDKIEKIKKNALKLYNEKIKNPKSNVSKRCCDFKLLEKVCRKNFQQQEKETIIYLIRHAETVAENGIRNTNEDAQMVNENEILSVQGEEQAKKLSENTELQNLDVIWSSSYTRAKATAKYIANKNNLQYNLDKRLCERKLGNIEDLAKFMNGKETRDPSREQLAFPNFKTRDGESAKDTNKRMNEFIAEILEKYEEKRIAIVSHGGAIKFYLLSYCKVNERLNLEYKGRELVITSPCLLKMTFIKNELVNLEEIN